MKMTIFFIAVLMLFSAAKGEAVRSPLPLSDRWIVFMKVKEPANYHSLPVTLSGTDSGKSILPYYFKRASTLDVNGAHLWLNWFADQSFEAGDRAIIFNEFQSDKDTVVDFGYGADWYSKVYLNGKLLIDLSKLGNSNGNYSPNNHKLQLNVRKGVNLLAVVVEAGSAGWRFTWGVPSPEAPPVVYTIGKDYQPLDLSKVTITAGSALDLSSLSDAPAGKYGRIVQRNGHFSYENKDEAIRLMGGNLFSTEVWYKSRRDNIPVTREEFEANAVEFARATRAQGYNCIRLHGLDLDIMRDSKQDMVFDRETLDRWDFMLAQFKKQGIYVKYVVFSFNFYGTVPNYQSNFRGKDMHRLMYVCGREWERGRFVRGMNQLLNHVNPYTGLAWKDDPVIAVIDCYNEKHSGPMRVNQVAEMYPEDFKFFVEKWSAWLKSRYADTPKDQLPKSLRNGFDNPPVPGMGQGGKDLTDDYGRFLYEITTAANRWAVEEIRKAGFPGLVTDCHCSQLFDVAASWSSLPSIDAHTYFMHPISGRPTRVDQQSSISQLAGCFAAVNSSRIAGRPFGIGEYFYAWFNQYQYEQPLTFGAYAALNNYSALEIYGSPAVELKVNTHIFNDRLYEFNLANSGVMRGGEFITSMLFRRGDVKPAGHKLRLYIPNRFLSEKGNWLKAVNYQQNKLGILSDFSVIFPELPLPDGLEMPSGGDLNFLPAGSSEVNAQEWFSSVVESSQTEFSMKDAVSKMREKGILSANNITNVEKNIYQSETEELTLYGNEKKMTVITPKTEAVARPASEQPVKLGALTVRRSSADAMIAATAVDNVALEDSRRIVLVISTRNVNNNMKTSADGITELERGTAPVLYRTGQYELALKNKNSHFKCYALNLAGDRTQELPVQYENGQLVVKLDTSALKNGPTPFFEFVTK